MLLAAVAACSPRTEGSPTILVLAAASTVDALDAAIDDFHTISPVRVRVSYGPTSMLARQVAAGAPAALLLSASTDWADFVEKRTGVRNRSSLAGNRLVVVVPASPSDPDDRPATIVRGPENLLETIAARGVERLALADPEGVPAGIYARQALERLGLWEQPFARLLPTVDVRAALALAASGEAEAALVYATDASSTNRVRVVAEFDPSLHPPIEYPLLLLEDAGRDAEELFEFLLSVRGRAHFASRGFAAPPE